MDRKLIEQEAECMNCHLPYKDFGLDITLPDGQWKLINPNVQGLLCANCIARIADLIPGSIAIRATIDIAGIPSPGGVEEDFQYPTYLEAGGNKEWDSMTELEQANYNLRKALNALTVSKTIIKRLREKQFPQPDKDKEIAELKADMQIMEEQDRLRCEAYEKLICQMESQQATIDELREEIVRLKSLAS